MTNYKVFSAKYNSANENLLEWQETSSLPIGLSDFATVKYNQFIYLFGGNKSSIIKSNNRELQLSDKIYRAEVQNDGNISGWSELQSSLPFAGLYPYAIVVEDSIMITGILNGSSTADNIWVYKIKDDGTLTGYELLDNSSPQEIIDRSIRANIAISNLLNQDLPASEYQKYKKMYLIESANSSYYSDYGRTDNLVRRSLWMYTSKVRVEAEIALSTKMVCNNVDICTCTEKMKN